MLLEISSHIDNTLASAVYAASECRKFKLTIQFKLSQMTATNETDFSVFVK